jgi:hypothetical protein
LIGFDWRRLANTVNWRASRHLPLFAARVMGRLVLGQRLICRVAFAQKAIKKTTKKTTKKIKIQRCCKASLPMIERLINLIDRFDVVAAPVTFAFPLPCHLPYSQ